jgi:hypothetical protein
VTPRFLFGLVLSSIVALPAGGRVMRSEGPAGAVGPVSDRPRLIRGAAGASCTGNSRLMQWPTANPVWEFCFVSPVYSSGANGSGLELHDVFYNGYLVFKRAHAPILNVLYAPGGCGCYRDWFDQEVRFDANNVLVGGLGGYAEPTVPPVTVCDANGSQDYGAFTGVAAEKLTDRLILTTQAQAGWYRYLMKWTFFLDGRIQPEVGFGARNTSSCLNYDHTHHNYWRFDFDIDGAGHDRVYETNQAMHIPESDDRPGVEITSEALRLNDQGTLYWTLRDWVSGRGYRLSPGPGDEVPAGKFGVGDVWLLRYNAAQIDDAGQPGPACAIKFDNFINGETLQDQDIVMWYRGGAFHHGGDLDDCHRVGPLLEPIGNWTPIGMTSKAAR